MALFSVDAFGFAVQSCVVWVNCTCAILKMVIVSSWYSAVRASKYDVSWVYRLVGVVRVDSNAILIVAGCVPVVQYCLPFEYTRISGHRISVMVRI